MNWTKASAMAEILSSVAILVTLVYLAIEIRQNSATLEASTQQAQLDTNIQTLNVAMNNPEIWLSRVKPTLTEEESVRLSAYLIAVVLRGQVAWQQHQTGALNTKGWGAAKQAVIGNLKYTQCRRWWRTAKDWFDPDFSDHISGILADTPIDDQLDDVELFR